MWMRSLPVSRQLEPMLWQSLVLTQDHIWTCDRDLWIVGLLVEGGHSFLFRPEVLQWIFLEYYNVASWMVFKTMPEQ
jgi:hypothetical protein